MKQKRRFMAPPDSERCVAVAHTLGNNELSRCMKRRALGYSLCWQHAKLWEAGKKVS